MIDYFSLYFLQTFSDNFLFFSIILLALFFFGLLLNIEKFPKIKNKFFLLCWFIASMFLAFFIEIDLKSTYKKELKNKKVENVKLFEENIKQLQKINSDKKNINKILNDFYPGKENNKKIENEIVIRK